MCLLVATASVSPCPTTLTRPVPWYKIIIHTSHMKLRRQTIKKSQGNGWLTHPNSLVPGHSALHNSFAVFDLTISDC